MANETPDKLWRELIRRLPDLPLEVVLNEQHAPSSAPTWAEIRAKLVSVRPTTHRDLLPVALTSVLKSWTPAVAAEIGSVRRREEVFSVFERCRTGLRELPADLDERFDVIDDLERELQDALLKCGERTAQLMSFADSGGMTRSTNRGKGTESGPEPTPEDLRIALLHFLDVISARLADGVAPAEPD